MKNLSLSLLAVAALSSLAPAQDLGWNTDAGAAFVQSFRVAAVETRAAAPRQIAATPLPGASYSDDASANAAHTVTLFFRHTCGADRAATCAPFCADGACDYDFPVVASVETSEGELGRWVPELFFVFPQLAVVDGKVLLGGARVGTVDPLTKSVRLADGWRAGFAVAPASAGLHPVSVSIEKTALRSGCDIRSDRPGCGP